MNTLADEIRRLATLAGDRLAEPWVGGLALPFAVALLGTLLLGRLGRKTGPQIAGAGLGLGFLAAFVWLAGGIPFRHSLPYHAVGEVAVLALGCGLLAGAAGLTGRTLQLAMVAATLAAIVHTVGVLPSRRQLESGHDLGFLLVAAAGALAAWRVGRTPTAPALPLCSLLAAAAGLAAVAGFGRALFLAQLAEGLAAASFALMLLGWFRRVPKGRVAAGAAVLVPAAAVLGALVQSSVTAAPTAPWPTLPLVLCFFPDEIAALLPGGGKKPSITRRLLAAALPALLAAAAAWFLSRR